MAKTKKVYVVACETAEEISYSVHPPAIVLNKGDTFKIVNVTDQAWGWKIEAGPFGGKAKHGHIAPRRQTDGVTVPKNVVLEKYDYTVKLANSRTKARGNSDPMIIIDPEP